MEEDKSEITSLVPVQGKSLLKVSNVLRLTDKLLASQLESFFNEAFYLINSENIEQSAENFYCSVETDFKFHNRTDFRFVANSYEDYHKAITLFNAVIEIRPSFKFAHYYTGVAKRMLKDYKGAIVEIIEPYKGTIFDPACGSGGMFVQSSYFVDRRKEELHDTDTKDLMVYGAERTPPTVKLARMNLAVNGLRGEIKPANSYYEDPYDSYGKFDFVMANPPFNVDEVNFDRVKDQKRFNEYGIPQNKTKGTAKSKKNKDINTVPNANYLWINLFATSLKPKGRAALVMANSASDGRNSEADIRKNLIKSGVIDCMLTLPKNMFYTVTLPATLWFFDKSKAGREPKVLFIDARNIFRQIDRAHREFTEEQIQNIATIIRLHRGETKRLKEILAKYKLQADGFEKQAQQQSKELETLKKGKPTNEKEIKKWEKQFEDADKKMKEIQYQHQYYLSNINWLNERFPNGSYEDVIGLCKSASLKEIEENDFSLNPGRYVGVVIEEDGLTEEEFLAEMQERHTALSELNNKAADLVEMISSNLLLLDK